jgi:hypothetical protein
MANSQSQQPANQRKRRLTITARSSQSDRAPVPFYTPVVSSAKAAEIYAV